MQGYIAVDVRMEIIDHKSCDRASCKLQRAFASRYGADRLIIASAKDEQKFGEIAFQELYRAEGRVRKVDGIFVFIFARDLTHRDFCLIHSEMKGIKAIPVNTEERRNSYWWYRILIDLDVVSIPAKDFIKELIAMGIPCSGILWPESYLEQAYQDGIGFGTAKFPFKSKEYTNPASVHYSKVVCPVAKSLRDQTVSLFLHPSWEKCHIEKVIEGVRAVIAKYSK